MNPYQPPIAKDEASQEPPLMQVRYGKAYTWFLAAMAMVVVIPNALILFTSPVHNWLRVALLPCGFPLLWLALESRRAVFFEVFEDRLEFLSLGLKWRRVQRPLQFRFSGWSAHGEDFARFEAWRQARG